MSLKEIRQWHHARPGYWFVPKFFGFGATPVTWQGWVATLGFSVAAIAVALLMPTQATRLGTLTPMMIAFLWLVWNKTDGEWGWRWGGGK